MQKLREAVGLRRDAIKLQGKVQIDGKYVDPKALLIADEHKAYANLIGLVALIASGIIRFLWHLLHNAAKWDVSTVLRIDGVRRGFWIDTIRLRTT